jgi:primosomal protein N' (replication factor Y)
MIARVVPDVPSFAVDDGFRYAIPPDIEVEVGAIVRVPLGGRKVRGFVVGIEAGDDQNLKPIRARSGKRAIFDSRLLQSLRWVAHHYVSPLSTVLKRAAPPNIPRDAKAAIVSHDLPELDGPATELGRQIAAGRSRNAHLQSADPHDLVRLVAPIVSGGSSVMIVAPTGVEAERIRNTFADAVGDVVLSVGPESPDREVTTAWSNAAGESGYVLIGTPRISLWPVAGIRAAVIVGDSRRGMKDRQTPTIHAREVLRARGGIERFAVITTGLVPSAEMIAAGAEVIETGPSRPWSLIEIVDRREDPPGTGVLSDRTKTAIAAAVKREQGVFVFTHRRGYAPVFRCVACRELRTCRECGAKVGQSGECPRCGAVLGVCGKCGKGRFEPLGAGVDRVAELVKRIVDPNAVGMGGEGRQVTVGSVRDLPLLERITLAVVADADGLVLGTDYRAAEEALRSLARVAAVVGSGSGRRTIVQTSNPEHPVLEALRRAEVLPFLDAELEQRAAFGFPPAGDLIVLECRDCPEGAHRDLEKRLPDAAILGPAETDRGTRWLLQAKDLAGTRNELRKIAGEWRDGGASLRIDVDPIDL